MTAVRPPNWPTVQPASSGGTGGARTAAQKAFFEAALGRAGAAQAPATQTPVVRAQTMPQPAAERVRSTFVQQTAEQPQKILRPGSIIDIKV
ncbi:hypothetical protein [Caulobacter mirabilis]|uniref:Uncharacterized protein n=1 Tax=Caulobacter mirabilis TaxID=69666 RepID=A0A2D2B2M0_9CAUL|nr:hypothetical protein [Caulobacter mirabilis]ATQ44477.1 hypothetical protein CSW64_19850 [Caulobacter mirabilis]